MRPVKAHVAWIKKPKRAANFNKKPWRPPPEGTYEHHIWVLKWSIPTFVICMAFLWLMGAFQHHKGGMQPETVWAIIIAAASPGLLRAILILLL